MNLTNKRVLITRPRAQAEEFASTLKAVGAKPIFFPVIKIVPPDNFSVLDYAIRSLEQYDWLILTSIHGVDAFFKRLDFLGIKKIPVGLNVAAVGAKTAQRISEHGIQVDYMPEEYLSEAISAGLGNKVYGKRFLFPQSNLARRVLANEIRNAGGIVTEIVVYRTVLNTPDSIALDALRAGVEIVTFTSPSTVQNFIAVVQKNGFDPFRLPGDPLFACIGPITERAAREQGLLNVVMAKEYTMEGLIEEISKHTQVHT